MKQILAVIILLILLFFTMGCSSDERFPLLNGDYLGQEFPGPEPRLFAPGIVSTGMYERDIAVLPDGNEIYYGLATDIMVTIMVTRRENGRWTEPRPASFAENPDYFYFEPCLNPDGKRIFFLSTMPPPGEKPKPGWGHQNIWTADRKEDGTWGEATDLGPPVNTDGAEYFPSMTRSGVLYFTRVAAGEQKPALYRARPRKNGFFEPERLPEAVNGRGSPFNAFIAPDESYLVSCVAGMDGEENAGTSRYYVFFRNEDDTWTEAVDMGEPVNGEGFNAISPGISPDGRFFFFASNRKAPDEELFGRPLTLSRFKEIHAMPRNGKSDIYWMDAAVIQQLRIRKTP
ncbi:MAG: PD40 domain-containing protein [Candidatus Aminicenantes bacterium]|nr:PD40 domain-containing protein [Candidatus Aminicenantes bacterium]